MEPKHFEYPFLTRDMLNFEQGTKFSIVVKSASIINTTLIITGATRSGLFTLKHTCVNTEVPQTESFNMSDIPMWISVRSTVQDTAPGQVYAQVSFALNDDIMQPLCSGYLFGFKSISWPNVNLEPPIPDDWPFSYAYNGSDPAAGSEFTWSNKAYSISEIKAITFTLVTSATVANRRVHISIFDGDTGNLDFHSSVDQTAGQTRNYTCAPVPALGSYANDNDIIIPIPAGISGWGEFVISSATVNLQAGDNFSAPLITVVEKRSTMFF